MAASTLLTLLLLTRMASGQHHSRDTAKPGINDGTEVHRMLDAHAVLGDSSPGTSSGEHGGVRDVWRSYVDSLTHAADFGTADSQEEALADEDISDGGEAHMKVCTCSAGIPAIGARCDEHGAEICTTCNPGFVLTDGRCQQANAGGPAQAEDDYLVEFVDEVRALSALNGTNATTTADTTTAEITTVDTTTATQADTTTAEITTVETTTTTPEGLVRVNMTVEGIDYNGLVANETARTNFILAAREAFAELFSVALERVQVFIYAGSVQVEGIVDPPPGVPASELMNRTNGTVIADVVVEYIVEADDADRIGFSAVGSIQIPQVDFAVIQQPEDTTTILATGTCTCRDGTPDEGRDCAEEDTPGCLRCNAKFELSDDREQCEVDELGALTGSQSGCTFEFVGGGPCHEYHQAAEKQFRIVDWTAGDREAAERACCRSGDCYGFQLDKHTDGTKASRDYVLLTVVGAYNVSGPAAWHRRECWEKITKNGRPVEPPPEEEDDDNDLGAAAPRLPPIAAAAAAWLLAAGA